MNRLFIFNPDNDGALAFGKHHYTPPKNAALLKKHGAFLPAWIADDSDIVACGRSQAADRHIIEAFRLECRLLDNENVGSVESIMPWGWSPSIKDELISLGIDCEKLPDENTLSAIRMLSHRRTSIQINNRLAQAGISTPPEAFELDDADRLDEITAHYNHVFIKSPWSSSGRGVFSSSGTDTEELKRRVAGIIHRQGSVIVEKQLDKIMDFAMLFESDGVKTRFIGLSVFKTGNLTAYSGNLIAPQYRLREKLSEHIDIRALDLIAKSLESILSESIAPFYKGYLGVDMMIYRNGDNRLIAPCVELNLRTTMGILALNLAKKYLADGSEGSMTIKFGTEQENGNPVIEDGRLVKGYVDLTAPNRFFQFKFSACPADIQETV